MHLKVELRWAGLTYLGTVLLSPCIIENLQVLSLSLVPLKPVIIRKHVVGDMVCRLCCFGT